MIMVRACPICGAELENTCYHDGEDFEAIQMPAERAKKLRGEQAEDVLSDLVLSDLSLEDLIELRAEIDGELSQRRPPVERPRGPIVHAYRRGRGWVA